MGERVRPALLAEVPDLIIDLRHLSKGRSIWTFGVYIGELEKIIDELTAAGKRKDGVALCL